MLVHESVFESQIHELHRLYQRQKELMMEMEGSRQQDEEEALYLNSSVPSPTTHWMSSSVSIYQTRNFPCEQQLMPNQLTEMNLEDHHKTAVSSIVLKKQKRRSYVKGKRKSDHQHIFSECEAKEDLQVKLDEVSDQEGDCMVVLKKNRRSKPIEAFTWGAKSKRRRRGSRIPALDFQPMIIDQ
ncbi:uncharacterized protein LOC108847487 [Raphanus sativus]|uniref:Uncharacterized protein LOC108847487 n=1 Tax=Raphanus sativus TaxID=3726 RepID=A0A6J0MX62_RAPSA|nr:uncharacterized protein LOC108847487 [Raphanus sativus]